MMISSVTINPKQHPNPLIYAPIVVVMELCHDNRMTSIDTENYSLITTRLLKRGVSWLWQWNNKHEFIRVLHIYIFPFLQYSSEKHTVGHWNEFIEMPYRDSKWSMLNTSYRLLSMKRIPRTPCQKIKLYWHLIFICVVTTSMVSLIEAEWRIYALVR